MPDHLPAAEGPPRDAAIELASGADILIHDSQFVTAEHTPRRGVRTLDAGAGHRPGGRRWRRRAGAVPSRSGAHRRSAAGAVRRPRSRGVRARSAITLGREGDEFTPSGAEVGSRSAPASSGVGAGGGVGTLNPIAAPPPVAVRRLHRSAEPSTTSRTIDRPSPDPASCARHRPGGTDRTPSPISPAGMPGPWSSTVSVASACGDESTSIGRRSDRTCRRCR